MVDPLCRCESGMSEVSIVSQLLNGKDSQTALVQSGQRSECDIYGHP